MIGFRVDANEKIATGHLMRCIAIAAACIKRGVPCIFLPADDKGVQKLKEWSMPYHILNTEWDNMESEKDRLKQIISEEKINYMIVDSYQATASYLEWLNGIVPVLYIDDMAKEIYHTDAVLHYSNWKEDSFYRERYKDTSTMVLSGMEYTPLREEFTASGKIEREKSILITTGGTDPFNVTLNLLNICLKNQKLSLYSYHVIVGSMNLYEEQLRQLSDLYPNVILHKNVKNMGDYMRKCEMAVSAGGTTLFELCACAAPTVCFSFADNQTEFAKQMGEHQIMLYAGDARYQKAIEQDICNKLLMFSEDDALREKYSRNMSQLVDGRGCERIAERVCGIHHKAEINLINNNSILS